MTLPASIIYVAPLLSFAASFLMVRWLLKGGLAGLAMDHPNARSLHAMPIPRTGGLGMMFSVLAAWIFVPSAVSPTLWIALAMLLAVSFADDLRGLPIAVRFAAQFIAAGLAMGAMLYSHFGALAIAVAIVTTVWMTNLYNFMDGSDGLAGGMALFGFGFYGLAAWLAGDDALSVLNLCVSAAAAAFLVFNFHPARIFMGDAGSIPLGFLAAALGIKGWVQGDWPVWFPALVFSSFVADATVTLVKRALRGDKVWHAHREHYYQRLVQIGVGHRNTAFLEYGVMLAAGASAVWAASQGALTQIWVGAVWSVFYLTVMLFFDKYWNLHSSGGDHARNT